MANLTSADTADLERMLDSSSLHEVLDTLRLICHEKADHIRSSWQDERTAKVWDRRGRLLYNMLARITF